MEEAVDQAPAQEQQAERKPEPWTKKRKRKKVKSNYRGGKKGRHWSWGFVNVFRSQEKKWTTYGRLTRPTLRTTIAGCIYYAIRELKKATDRRVYQQAMENGLGEISRNKNLFPRVQKEMRILAAMGIVARAKVSRAERVRLRRHSK